MFQALAKLLRKTEIPREPFVDQSLGAFIFEAGLGWKSRILLGGKNADLVLGSDGERPSDEMLQTAKSWVEVWPTQFPKIIEYIHRELPNWSSEPNLPIPEKFEVNSINILWKDRPRTSMIEFDFLGDDSRIWHVTYDGFEPHGFAYDD